MPPPEVDPNAFERDLSGRFDHAVQRSSGRHRRVGIILMGVGFGLMILIGFAGQQPSKAIGVGGFLAVLGLAFLINSLFESHAASSALPALPPILLPAPSASPSDRTPLPGSSLIQADCPIHRKDVFEPTNTITP